MTKATINRLPGRRSHSRHPVAAPASVLTPALPGAMLVDISSHGCRITGSIGPVTVGAPISLRPVGLPPMTAWVRWSLSGEIGLEFARPLPASVVDHLAAAHAFPVELDMRAA